MTAIIQFQSMWVHVHSATNIKGDQTAIEILWAGEPGLYTYYLVL